jgi:hypothetical protein
MYQIPKFTSHGYTMDVHVLVGETEDKIEEEIEAEANGKIVSVAAAIIDPVQPIEWHLDKISKWQKLLRRTGWIVRFINRIRE